MTGRRRDDAGAVSVVLAVVLASGMLFGVGALAVDLGDAYARQSSLQKVADLAALAAAQALPDVTAARTAAVASLCADANRPVGWPWTGPTAQQDCVDDTSWQTSPDPLNPDETDGEIEFYTGDPGSDGRYPDSQRIDAASGLAATAIRVITPPARVRFGLASGVPGMASSLTVQKAATATVRSPLAGGLLPFYLMADEPLKTTAPALAKKPICVMKRAPAVSVPGDCPRTAAMGRTARALRGFINEPVDNNPGIQAPLRANVVAGINHPVNDFRYWPCGSPTVGAQLPSNGPCLTQSLPTDNATCGAAVIGDSLATGGSAALWTPGVQVNCLTVGIDDWFSSLTRSLLTDPGARLQGSCSGSTSGVGHGVPGNSYDATQLLDSTNTITLPPSLLGTPGLSASQLAQAGDALARGQANPLGVPLLSNAIFSCGRLGVVPILDLHNSQVPHVFTPASVTYPVVGFSYVWLGSADNDNGIIWDDDDVAGIRLQPIDPSFFPPTPPLTDDLGPLLISDNLPGPKTVRLIHDAADPLS